MFSVHLAGDGGGGAQAGPHHRRPPVLGLVPAPGRVCNMGGSHNLAFHCTWVIALFCCVSLLDLCLKTEAALSGLSGCNCHSYSYVTLLVFYLITFYE